MRPFLPVRVPTDTSIAPSTAAQPVGRERQFLAGHVVDVELDQRDALVGDRVALREHQHAQYVRHALERARAGTEALRKQPATGMVGVDSVGRDQMAQDCRAGGRDALSGDAVVTPRIPFEQARGRRTRHRQHAVRGADRAAAAWRSGGAPLCAVERRGDRPGGDHVHARVPVGQLVEVHRVACGAVHPCLGVGEEIEYCKRVRSNGGVERRTVDLVADRLVAAAVIVVLVCCRAMRPARTPARVVRRLPCRETLAAAQRPAGPRRGQPVPARAMPAARRPSPRRTCRRRYPRPGRDGSSATLAQAGQSRGTIQATTGTTYGPSGITASVPSPARANAASSADSTEPTFSTPVRRRSSSPRPVV